MATEQQATQIGAATEDNNGSSVAEQRNKAAAATRMPATGMDPAFMKVVDVLANSVAQNAQILGQNAQLLAQLTSMHQEDNLKQTAIMTAVRTEAQKLAAVGEIASDLQKEIKKARKGKKSKLFHKTRWDKAEDAAYHAGAVAVGTAAGVALVAMARYGTKAMFGGT